MSRPRSGRGGRAGRARCCAYVDHVLALLPFEPEAYRRLRGPPCSYVGHPLTEQIAQLRPDAERAAAPRRGAAGAAGAAGQPPQRDPAPHGGVRRALGRLRDEGVAFELMLPTMPHLRGGGARGRCKLAGAAAHRDRRAGEAGGVPDRARGAGQIRHRDAGTGAGRRADGDGLSDRRGRGLDPAARDQASIR